MEKENNSNEIDFKENGIPDVNSLKANIGDINSSSSDDEEEGAEYKVSEWCKCSGKAVVGRCSSK